MDNREMFALVSDVGQILEIAHTEEELKAKQTKHYPITNTSIKKCYVLLSGEHIVIKYVPKQLIESVKRIRIFLNCGLAEAKGMCDAGQIVCDSPGKALRLIKELEPYGTIVDVIGLPETYRILYGS